MNFLLALVPAPYQLIAKCIAIAALCAALLFAWHQFTGHYIAIGKASRQTEVDKLNIERQRLAFAAQRCSDSVAALQAAGDKKRAAYTQALQQAQKQAAGLQAQSDWLLAQLNRPDVKNKGCADALKEWRAQP